MQIFHLILSIFLISWPAKSRCNIFIGGPRDFRKTLTSTEGPHEGKNGKNYSEVGGKEIEPPIMDYTVRPSEDASKVNGSLYQGHYSAQNDSDGQDGARTPGFTKKIDTVDQKDAGDNRGRNLTSVAKILKDLIDEIPSSAQNHGSVDVITGIPPFTPFPDQSDTEVLTTVVHNTTGGEVTQLDPLLIVLIMFIAGCIIWLLALKFYGHDCTNGSDDEYVDEYGMYPL